MIVAIPTIWVFLLGFTLKPLGLGECMPGIQIQTAFGLATAVVSWFVAYILPLIFKKFYNPESWTKGKFFSIYLSIVVLITPFVVLIVMYFMSRFSIAATYTFSERVFVWVPVIFIVGAFPTIVIYFLTKNSWVKSQQANVKNELVEEIEKENIEQIILCGSTKETVTLQPDMFLYAEVVGNYVTVYYIRNNKVEFKSLRATLSQITGSLQTYPQIVRCHRAFIVNMSNVSDMQGNYKNSHLILRDSDIEIPVSRSYIKEIKSLLKF